MRKIPGMLQQYDIHLSMLIIVTDLIYDILTARAILPRCPENISEYRGVTHATMFYYSP